MSDKLVNLYFSRISSCRYVFPDGSEAAFISGRYSTDDPAKIANLDYEISKGHPHIFTDPDKLQVSESSLDPMEELKAKIISEYLAKQEQEAKNPTQSESIPQPLKPASSADLVDTKTVQEIALSQLGKK